MHMPAQIFPKARQRSDRKVLELQNNVLLTRMKKRDLQQKKPGLITLGPFRLRLGDQVVSLNALSGSSQKLIAQE